MKLNSPTPIPYNQNQPIQVKVKKWQEPQREFIAYNEVDAWVDNMKSRGQEGYKG